MFNKKKNNETNLREQISKYNYVELTHSNKKDYLWLANEFTEYHVWWFKHNIGRDKIYMEEDFALNLKYFNTVEFFIKTEEELKELQ